jgi:hypothetical protein
MGLRYPASNIKMMRMTQLQLACGAVIGTTEYLLLPSSRLLL